MHNDPIRLEKSRLLSESIQSSLISNTGAVNMGVDRNTFAVLRETAVPATLVELGFMTNYNEFLKITNSNYQKKLANGIVNGIHQYFKFWNNNLSVLILDLIKCFLNKKKWRY